MANYPIDYPAAELFAAIARDACGMRMHESLDRLAVASGFVNQAELLNCYELNPMSAFDRVGFVRIRADVSVWRIHLQSQFGNRLFSAVASWRIEHWHAQIFPPEPQCAEIPLEILRPGELQDRSK